MRARLLASRLCRAVLRPRRQVSDVTNLEIVRQNTALITYADGTTEHRDTRTLRQDDATTSAWMRAPAALDATASEFACAALDESPFLSRAALLDRKVNKSVPNPVDTPATRFGQASEPLAVQAYRDKSGFDVRATGLYTCDELRYGASPDGVVVDRATGEEGLLEWSEANGASKFRAAILDVAGDLDDLKHITEPDCEELVKGMPKLKARRLRASLVELGARLA